MTERMVFSLPHNALVTLERQHHAEPFQGVISHDDGTVSLLPLVFHSAQDARMAAITIAQEYAGRSSTE